MAIDQRTWVGENVETDEKEDRTKEFYEQAAEAYAASTREADLWPLHFRLQQLLPRGARVIDLGCGAGRDVRSLRAVGFQAYGLDFAATPLHLARRSAAAPYVLADIGRLPFASNSFAAAWAVASLLHIQKTHIVQVLEGIGELVVHGGFLFVSTKLGTGERVTNDGRHFSLYGEGEWLNDLKASGWQVEHVEHTTEPRPHEIVKWLLTVSRRIRRS